MAFQRFFSLLLFFSQPILLFSGIYDLQKHGYEQYQDIYLNGKVVRKASNYERFGNRRFEILDAVLSQYERPFTMLDIGASQGYFTFRAAEKYPKSVFVMIEGSNPNYPLISKQLSSICKANKKSKNIIWLDRSICAKDFSRLASCEHVDVILAQNILHWFPNEWKTLLDNFRQMSHVTIIELPPNEETLGSEQYHLREDLHSLLAKEASQVVEGVPRHTNPTLKTTYYILINKSGLAHLEKTSMVHPNFGDRDHIISFDFHEKKLIKREMASPHKETTVIWAPGINLISFLCLNGQYPMRSEVVKSLALDLNHKDWMLNNMILQGQKMVLINKGDPKNEPGGKGKNLCTKKRIKKCKNLIINGDEASVHHFLRIE